MTAAAKTVAAGRLNPARSSAGFTLLGMMILVAGLGILLASAGEIWHTAEKRDKERELLFVGNQFRQALDHYSAHTPARAPRYPTALEDLLLDPRVPGLQRHLRKIYVDPMTGRAEWQLIRGGPGGEILGVSSLSEETPIKTGHFRKDDRAFENKTKYSDWLFMSAPR